MNLLLWGTKGDLDLELVDPFTDLVGVGKEHGQAVLGADACPIHIIIENGAIVWDATIGKGNLQLGM